jgi:hypothetical protein
VADPGFQGAVPPLADPVAEAERILAAAHAADVPLRVIGGVAVRLHTPDMPAPLARTYGDIDMATPKGKGRPVAELLTDLGYEPARQFNALQGETRLLFQDRGNDRKLDVFVGQFELNHAIPITRRIDVEPVTIPLAELLLTKLQVVEYTEKDMRDTIALLLDHEVSDHDGDAINGDVVAALTAEDWGLWRTTEINLERIRGGLRDVGLDRADEQIVRERVDAVWQRIEGREKSRRWRLRAKVGERKRWYAVPDEV